MERRQAAFFLWHHYITKAEECSISLDLGDGSGLAKAVIPVGFRSYSGHQDVSAKFKQITGVEAPEFNAMYSVFSSDDTTAETCLVMRGTIELPPEPITIRRDKFYLFWSQENKEYEAVYLMNGREILNCCCKTMDELLQRQGNAIHAACAERKEPEDYNDTLNRMGYFVAPGTWPLWIPRIDTIPLLPYLPDKTAKERGDVLCGLVEQKIVI